RPAEPVWRRAFLRPAAHGWRQHPFGFLQAIQPRFRALRPPALPRRQGRPAEERRLQLPGDGLHPTLAVLYRPGSTHSLLLRLVRNFLNDENRLTVELRELLKFYAEAGVDEAIEEVAIDRFAEFAAQAAKTGVAGTRASQAAAAGDAAPGIRAEAP